MSTAQANRRSYGTGSLDVRTDANGRETWYGRWHAENRRVKRRIGLKRTPGSRDGLTRAQAEAELRRLVAETRVAPRVGVTLTIGELTDRYKADLQRRGRKPTAIGAVDVAARVHLTPFFGDRALDSIRPEDVEDLVAMLEARGLAPKSIRNYAGTLSALFNYARSPRRRWASGNPCDGIELPDRVEQDEIRFLDVEQVEALVAAVPSGDWQGTDKAIFLAAAMTGLRQGELIALRWRDVDWSAGKVRVRRNYVRGEFGTPKSKRSSRSVPLADRVAGELERHFKRSRWQGDDDLVFPDPRTGRPMQRTALLDRFRAALTAARLDEARRFHDLRHTFGTRMAAAGVPMRTLQEWMGHRDIATTQIYADYEPSPREAELVQDAFRGPVRGPVVSESQVTSEN